MTQKNLFLLPDTAPILKEIMPFYNGDYSDIQVLVPEMFSLMEKKQGMGLAAPQIGLRMNFFIMKTAGRKWVCVNPIVVISSEETCTYKEGCLSFPGLYLPITRVESITVCYEDEMGISHTEDLAKTPARCFLHETDHLQGITFDTL